MQGPSATICAVAHLADAQPKWLVGPSATIKLQNVNIRSICNNQVTNCNIAVYVGPSATNKLQNVILQSICKVHLQQSSYKM
jgi:hypothetical protein